MTWELLTLELEDCWLREEIPDMNGELFVDASEARVPHDNMATYCDESLDDDVALSERVTVVFQQENSNATLEGKEQCLCLDTVNALESPRSNALR